MVAKESGRLVVWNTLFVRAYPLVEDPGISGSQEAAEERGWRCYQVNVLRVVGGSTDVENFRLGRRTGRVKERRWCGDGGGGGGGREEREREKGE